MKKLLHGIKEKENKLIRKISRQCKSNIDFFLSFFTWNDLNQKTVPVLSDLIIIHLK